MDNSNLHEFILQNTDLINNVNNYYKLGFVPSKVRYDQFFILILVSITIYLSYNFFYIPTPKNVESMKNPDKRVEQCTDTCKIKPNININESEINDDLISEKDEDLSDIEY